MFFRVKTWLNSTFNVGVSRSENDARTANCGKPSYSTADEQQRQKGKLMSCLKYNIEALFDTRVHYFSLLSS